LKVYRDENNPLNGKNPTLFDLIDYDQFCGLRSVESSIDKVKEITVQELHELIEKDSDFQLIDVREKFEYEVANLNGELIPLRSLIENADKISHNKKVVLHCRSGQRSADAIVLLEEKYGFQNLYNLKGGILAYANEVDTSLARY